MELCACLLAGLGVEAGDGILQRSIEKPLRESRWIGAELACEYHQAPARVDG